MGERRSYLPKSRGGLARLLERPVVLWAILVLAFFVIWQLLNGSAGSSGGSTPQAEAGSSSSFPPIWNVAILAASVLAVVGWARWLRHRTLLFNEESTQALALFTAADYAAAAERFAILGEKYRRPANVRATAQFNLGMSLLRTGDLARALATLTILDRATSKGLPSFRAKVAAQLAAVYALKGEPAAADRWLAEAEARLKGTGSGQTIEGALVLTRLVNGIRRDDDQAALETLTATWETLEGTLPTAEMRPFRALRAFATTRRHAPETLASDPIVKAAFEGVRPGELSWLAAEWSEMRAFLEAASPGT